SVGWNRAGDLDLRRTRTWAWDRIDLDWRGAPLRRLRSGLRSRIAGMLAGALGPGRTPPVLAACAVGRTHPELARAACRQPADLVYGGTSGALAAVAGAARTLGVPYALDLEDFHSAEQPDTRSGRLASTVVGRIEATVLPGAAFLTASSRAIAEAYADTYAIASPVTVHNTFQLP